MKIINVDEKTQIAFEDDNFMIQRAVKNKKTGIIRWVTEGYFRDMADCATQLLETLPTRSSTLTEDLKGVISAIKEAQDKILKAIR